MSGRREITAYIMHPSGSLHKERVKSHRAFEWDWGLYDVGNVFTDQTEERMMLLSAGNPVPHCGPSGKDKSVKIGEKMFISGLIKILNTPGAGKMSLSKVPKWVMVLLTFGFILLLVAIQ